MVEDRPPTSHTLNYARQKRKNATYKNSQVDSVKITDFANREACQERTEQWN